jgi:hypothetical protein
MSTDICSAANNDLFNHLVGDSHDAGRYCQPERLGGLQVDDQFEFGGLHHREIGRPFALENSTDIHAGLAIEVGDAGRASCSADTTRLDDEFLEAFRALLKKIRPPADLKDALRRSAGESTTVHELHKKPLQKPR